MVSKAIYKKEWFKLRWYLLALCVTALSSAIYFWFDLDFTFKSIEPESMMWYRFAQLEDKPYSTLAPFFLFCAVVVAVAQFLPEIIRNRVRILIHLPCRLRTVVAHHLFAGGLSIIIINSMMSMMIVAIIMQYYPPEIVRITGKDCFFWTLLGLALYLGLSGAILERNIWRKSFKLLLPLLLSLLYFKTRYAVGDLLLAALVLWLTLPVYDSFLSVKVQRLKSPLYKGSIVLVCLLIIAVGVTRYQEEYSRFFEKYYIFFSPVLNDFIYQKNSKGHQFVYGTEQTTFDRLAYEKNLPFVYWKNLDIQGELPFQINGESYDKQRIKGARLSLQYRPNSLATREVSLYPLFNPISNNGVIPFPEEVFSLKPDKVVVYDCETVRVNQQITNEMNEKLKAVGVSFPLQRIWGKTTNMKPFDWGYFVKDNVGQIFNLRRSDNELSVRKIPIPHDISSIAYMRISENRQKNFYGYAIDTNSRVFLVAYPDYQFIPLELADFDYRHMPFHLISDPLHYIVRYRNQKTYRAVLFSKQYQLLKTIEFM